MGSHCPAWAVWALDPTPFTLLQQRAPMFPPGRQEESRGGLRAVMGSEMTPSSPGSRNPGDRGGAMSVPTSSLEVLASTAVSVWISHPWEDRHG